MLQIYDPIFCVSIDEGPYQVVRGVFDNDWFASACDLMEKQYLLYNASFVDAYEYLRSNYISGARPSTSFFNVPQISLLYQSSGRWANIKKCKTFSLFVKNKLRENVTVDWIMKNLPANQAIQYLSERGAAINPSTPLK